jgi:phosphatidylserine/phosphatidylglycerophosphate/cardiolipin synthase-like enzyme
MNLIMGAGIPLRVVSAYTIHHDKYIVVDGKHTETGSFNFSQAAAKSNSENVLVVWNDT